LAAGIFADMKTVMPVLETYSQKSPSFGSRYPTAVARPSKIEVALAHHWVTQMRGGEKVLEEFGTLFPSAPIYTLVANKKKMSAGLLRHSWHSSPIEWMPNADRHYKKLLPFFPAALGQLRVQGSPQLLLTSDASVIKGLNYDPEIPHVCYCHSPPRYLWGMEETYLNHSAGLNFAGRLAFKAVVPHVRKFDYEAAQRVDYFIANSYFVADRIQKCYGKPATVIHPPVNLGDYCHDREREDYYLIVSELVPYKRVDLAVEAFNRLGKKLVIIGTGSELESLKARAKPNIAFLGRQPLFVLKHHFEHCRAFIMPGVEDFGITPLEAQAAGSPVIAYGEGGALETVVDGVTGRFFAEPTPQSLADTVTSFEAERHHFSPSIARIQAKKFSPERFRDEIKSFLRAKFPHLFYDYGWPDEPPLEIPPLPARWAAANALEAA
jgi:glycosyltransferase involved in cell wall biosynthesis